MSRQEDIDRPLELAWKVAEGKSALAQDIAWPMAIGWGLAAYFKWDSWLLAGAVVVATLWLVPRGPDKAARKALADYNNRTILRPNEP